MSFFFTVPKKEEANYNHLRNMKDTEDPSVTTMAQTWKT
jgi:hypothetical protein